MTRTRQYLANPHASAWESATFRTQMLTEVRDEFDRTTTALRIACEALNAIQRAHSARGGCLPACASNVGDGDCDCGYVAAESPGDFAADMLDEVRRLSASKPGPVTP